MAASQLNSLSAVGAVPSAPSRLQPPPAAPESTLQALGYGLTTLYIILLLGRVPEITSFVLRTSLYQILVVTLLTLPLLVLTGNLIKVGATKMGVFWIGAHAWALYTGLFSGNRGASLAAGEWLVYMLPATLFLGGFFSRNVEKLRKGVIAVGVGGLIALAWVEANRGSLKEGDDGRFASIGTFANSNEVAIYFLCFTPFWATMVLNSRLNWIARAIFAGAILAMFELVVLSGSRSGLLTIVLLGCIVFLMSSVSRKFVILVLFGLAAAGAVALMPPKIKERFETILTTDRAGQSETADSAIGSAQGRWELFKESVEMTLRHPVTGTGIGAYVDASAAATQKEGKQALWQVSHNMYTQVSAETGIPGFVLYMSTLILAFRGAWIVRRFARTVPELGELAATATAVLFALVVLCFNGIFTSMAWGMLTYAVFGLSMAVQLVGTEYMKAQEANGSRAGGSSSGPQAAPRELPVTAVAPAPGAAPAANQPVWRRNPRRHPPRPGTPSR